MRPAYPKKLVVSEVSEGFRIVLETGEHFPRDEKQYHLVRSAEELVEFVMRTYGVSCCVCGKPGEEKE